MSFKQRCEIDVAGRKWWFAVTSQNWRLKLSKTQAKGAKSRLKLMPFRSRTRKGRRLHRKDGLTKQQSCQHFDAFWCVLCLVCGFGHLWSHLFLWLNYQPTLLVGEPLCKSHLYKLHLYRIPDPSKHTLLISSLNDTLYDITMSGCVSPWQLWLCSSNLKGCALHFALWTVWNSVSPKVAHRLSHCLSFCRFLSSIPAKSQQKLIRPL